MEVENIHSDYKKWKDHYSKMAEEGQNMRKGNVYSISGVEQRGEGVSRIEMLTPSEQVIKQARKQIKARSKKVRKQLPSNRGKKKSKKTVKKVGVKKRTKRTSKKYKR